MKKFLLLKTLIFLLFFVFGSSNLYSQGPFCCCAVAGCTQNFQFPNDCNDWCNLIGSSNTGDAAGYALGCAGSICGAMPVETTFFKGRILRNNLVELTWETVLEIDNEGFEIHRADADFQWEFLGFEKGNGNTTETINYSFVDRTPYPGTNYYRFKQMDYDGNFEFSEIIVVNVKNTNGEVTIFPTLAKERLLIKYNEQPSDLPTYRVFDLMGRKILETKADNGVIDISGLNAGQYVISFLLKDVLVTEKFIKVN